MKAPVASLLQTERTLPLAAEKTLMPHAHPGSARCLGYASGMMDRATQLQ